MKPTAPFAKRLQCACHDTLPWLISFSLDHAVNWEAISAIGQIVGAIGVVVSLIYVATEVRNSARATQLASRRSISEIFTLLSRQLAEHPDLRELYYRGLHDFESLEGTDLVGFAQVMLQLFRAYEEAYYGHLEGDVDPRLWRGWEAAMRDINGYPGVQAYWRSRSHWYSEEFAKYINQLQQTAKPPRLYGEPNAVSNAIGYAMHDSRSADAVIRVYDDGFVTSRVLNRNVKVAVLSVPALPALHGSPSFPAPPLLSVV